MNFTEQSGRVAAATKLPGMVSEMSEGVQSAVAAAAPPQMCPTFQEYDLAGKPVKEDKMFDKMHAQACEAMANTLDVKKPQFASVIGNPVLPTYPFEHVVGKAVGLLEMEEHMFGKVKFNEMPAYMKATTDQAMQAQLDCLIHIRVAGDPLYKVRELEQYVGRDHVRSFVAQLPVVQSGVFTTEA